MCIEYEKWSANVLEMTEELSVRLLVLCSLQTLYSITEQWISSYKRVQGFLQELCVSSQCPYPDSLREDGLVEESTVSFLVACASFVLCVAAHGIIDQRDQEALRRNFGVCKSANGGAVFAAATARRFPDDRSEGGGTVSVFSLSYASLSSAIQTKVAKLESRLSMEMKSALSISHSFASDFATKFHTSVSHLFSQPSLHEVVQSAPVTSPQPYNLDTLLSSAFMNPPTESPIHPPEEHPIDLPSPSSISMEAIPSIPETSPAPLPIAPAIAAPSTPVPVIPTASSPPVTYKKNRRAYLLSSSPVELLADSPLEPFKLVRTHEFTMCATTRGTVVSWLQGSSCPLSSGLSDLPETMRSSPCLIPALHLELAYRDRKFHWVGHGGSYSVALSDAGEVYTWGEGRYGELGQGPLTQVSEPRLCVGLLGVRVVEVACGWDHVLARDEKGAIYSWGHNEYGQLGQGDRRDRWEPARVEPAAVLRMRGVGAGRGFSVAVSEKGHVFGFGRNDQVGEGERSEV